MRIEKKTAAELAEIYPPKTMAGRLEVIKALTEPRPIYCACRPDCKDVVGYERPLLEPTAAGGVPKVFASMQCSECARYREVLE